MSSLRRLEGVSSGAGRAGIVVPQQEPPRLRMPDPHDVAAEQRRTTRVIGVMMRMDQMGHLVADTVSSSDFVYSPLQVVADGWRRVEQHDAGRRGHERGLVHAIGHPVQISLDAANVVALFVDGGTEG